MINVGTLVGLHEHRHELAAYCPRCDRWSTLPLAELVAEGHGPRRLPIRVKRSTCGSPGKLQVRPPVPTRGPGGWMQIARQRVTQSDGSLLLRLFRLGVVTVGRSRYTR